MKFKTNKKKTFYNKINKVEEREKVYDHFL